jgi:biopolymer transport protein TolQ
MENQPVDTLTLDGSVATDLSIWGLFTQADVIVQIVMVLLLIASFWSWAIIFEKAL